MIPTRILSRDEIEAAKRERAARAVQSRSSGNDYISLNIIDNDDDFGGVSEDESGSDNYDSTLEVNSRIVDDGLEGIIYIYIISVLCILNFV